MNLELLSKPGHAVILGFSPLPHLAEGGSSFYCLPMAVRSPGPVSHRELQTLCVLCPAHGSTEAAASSCCPQGQPAWTSFDSFPLDQRPSGRRNISPAEQQRTAGLRCLGMFSSGPLALTDTGGGHRGCCHTASPASQVSSQAILSPLSSSSLFCTPLAWAGRGVQQFC